MNSSARLAIAFGAFLLAGLLLTSGLRGRTLAEVLQGITEGRPESAQAATGAEAGPAGEAAPGAAGIVSFFEAKLRGEGFSAAQAKIAAAGIAGNTMQESSDNPSAAGGGYFQDIGGRGAGEGAPGRAQLEAAWRELRGPYAGVLAQLRGARTPAAAARIFSEGFERPGVPMLANRERYAEQAYRLR